MATHRRRFLHLVLCAATAGLVAAACSNGGVTEHPAPGQQGRGFPVTLTDDNGVKVTVTAA